jgi:hypothetical protein
MAHSNKQPIFQQLPSPLVPRDPPNGRVKSDAAAVLHPSKERMKRVIVLYVVPLGASPAVVNWELLNEECFFPSLFFIPCSAFFIQRPFRAFGGKCIHAKHVPAERKYQRTLESVFQAGDVFDAVGYRQ